jgi:hypothetical protein
MGRTLYDILRSKVSRAEEGVYNPLKLNIGNTVQVGDPDLRDLVFNCTGIREYTRRCGGQRHQFADYDLIARPYNADPVRVRLRLNPLANPDPVSGLTHNVVVLRLYYECGFQDAVKARLENAVNAGTGEFEIDWNGKRKYFRMGGLQTPYQADVKFLEDRDGNGRVDVDEVRTFGVQYWDYHTELLNEANQKYTEYLFVEKNTSDGWWQLWRGSEVIPDRVSVL